MHKLTSNKKISEDRKPLDKTKVSKCSNKCDAYAIYTFTVKTTNKIITTVLKCTDCPILKRAKDSSRNLKVGKNEVKIRVLC